MPKHPFTLLPEGEREETCGDIRTPGSRTSPRCELNPKHYGFDHFGRSSSGRWFTWKVDRNFSKGA